MQQIHGGHLSIEKCKLRAKSCVYWPSAYKEIENLLNSCSVCQKYHNSQQKEPMIRAVVNEMKILFAENGIPESHQCDNGTQFTFGEFQQLASQYSFTIVTSSPHYPRRRGFVERQVQTVKKTILALLANIPSPAELLNGRVFKSTLPGEIQPSKNQEEVRNWLKARQNNQCYYNNRHTRKLPELHREPSHLCIRPCEKDMESC